MTDEPVLLLEGPRSVGKSTVLRELAARFDGTYVDLDDLDTRDTVARDPAFFVAGDRPVFIDEYQKEPLILDAVKAELNRDSSPGRFVLAGSARFDTLPRAAQSLTGRLHRLAIRPLSQGELIEHDEHFLDELLDGQAPFVHRTSTTSREDYIDRVTAGGFPMALRRSGTAARNRWFDDYTHLTAERDVLELSKIRQAAELPRLLQRLAGQTAQVLNLTKAAESTELDARTADAYARLLEAVFLVHRLPAWGTTTSSRATARPKVHTVDSGVAARLLRLTPENLAQRTPAALQQFGHLLETFVVMEVAKQASWSEADLDLGHWRTREGEEVDLVVERDDGAVVGIEVKASGRVPGADFAGLRKLRDLVGSRFVAGVVLYLGPRGYSFDDRLHVAPVDSLWQ